ncbi:MAG: type VI secretion system baseplate subunit TssE [Proteobacteria bacterium]|nr:type VI secretion system baseplate subunit TssE [Pseudomonadota bacterium]
MADLGPQERLQPSLLDRLTDDEPRKQVESRTQRVLSAQKLRESVKRDLSWLLNCGNLASAEDLEDGSPAAHSVLNYGVPELAGRPVSPADHREFERLLRQAILDFEPRILRRSVKVRAVDPLEEANPMMFAFEIEGELWAEPVPLHLLLRTDFDVEAGIARVSESRGSGG